MAAHQTPQPVSDNDELIVTLFLAAMSRPEPERAPFLSEACGADAALLAAVERRVKWEARLGGFLLTPVVPRERVDRPFLPGDAVLDDRFAILRVAGEGGMGVVYEAFDRRLDRRVALKCPHFEFRKRLPPEAMKALSVAHDNVCKVYGFHTEKGATGEVDFFTMEFLDGETLAARLERAPSRWLEAEEGRRIAQQLCDGLQAVHQQGIVHRDLKASNVMLTTRKDGTLRAVIMDFGIAQGADLFSSSVRGTPAYLAPELWKGRPASVQSDLYALSVLFYEMACSGRQPFAEGSTWEQRLKTLPAPAEASQRLRSAIARGLHPDRQRRYGSVAEFRRALWSPSRRWLLGVAAAGAVGVFAKERYWPSSAVRLAVLAPAIKGTGGDEATALITGFLHDLSYRFQTLRGARRPLTVYPLSQTSDGANAHSTATHVIASQFTMSTAGWSVATELKEAPSGRPVRQWQRSSTREGLAALLFALQSSVMTESIAQLSLHAEPKLQTLTRESYPDYLQGLHLARVDYENAANAVPLFERVIKASPESPLGYAGLAEALLNARYMITRDKSLEGRAFTAIAQAEQRDPDSAHVHLVAGKLSAAGGNNERALASYRRASELSPNDAEPYMESARALSALNRIPEAQAAFHTAFAVQPSYYKPYLTAGTHYFNLRDLAAAEKHWQEAVRLAPGQTRARLNLVSLYLSQGRLAEAEAQTLESLKTKRTRSALEALGAIFERSGRPVDAVAVLEEAVRLGPNFYKTWVALGDAYLRAGRQADGFRTYRRGLEDTKWGLSENPRDADRIAWCAFYHAKLGETVPARDRAAQALALANPATGDVYKYLALTYDALHDAEAALQVLEKTHAHIAMELAAAGDISPELRRHPRFRKLVGK